jgi:dihydroneopterin aldolase
MKQYIEVNGIKLYAYHGCMEEEAKIGGHYLVDILVQTDFTIAAQTDDLSKTVDYVAVNKIVKEEMAIRSKLIEHVGLRILNRIESEVAGILGISVKIKKLCPPINGDVEHVAIHIQNGTLK